MENTPKTTTFNLAIEIPDLSTIIAEEMTKVISEEAIRESVAKHCKNLADNFLDQSFRTHSEFGKSVKEHLETQLKFDPKKVPIPGYEDLIAESFKKAWKGMNKKELVVKAEKLMASILDLAPKTITIGELANLYLEHLKEYHTYELEQAHNETDNGIVYHGFSIKRREPESSYSSFYDFDFLVTGLAEEKVESKWSHKFTRKGLYLNLHVMITDKAGEKPYGETEIKKYDEYKITYGTMDNTQLTSIDMAEWHDMSDFAQLIYKMCKAGTIIIDDGSEPNNLEREHSEYSC